jgi:hypothetical protein
MEGFINVIVIPLVGFIITLLLSASTRTDTQSLVIFSLGCFIILAWFGWLLAPVFWQALHAF